MVSENDSPKKRDIPLVDSSSIREDVTIGEIPSSATNLATQATKSSNTVTIPTEVNQSKDVLVTPSKKSKTTRDLLLSKRDKEKAINSFVRELEAHGIETNLVIDKKVKGVIKKLTLQLAHQRGLKWEIKLQEFDHLEIKFLLNENKQLEGITYRLNQVGDFADFLTLRHKAKSFHKFGKKGTRHRHIKSLN